MVGPTASLAKPWVAQPLTHGHTRTGGPLEWQTGRIDDTMKRA
jgi:hypothetical protein